MCRERWLRRWSKERDAGRLLWNELEHARSLTDPEATDEEVDVVLEKRQQIPFRPSTEWRSVGPRSRRRTRHLTPAEHVEIRATPFA